MPVVQFTDVYPDGPATQAAGGIGPSSGGASSPGPFGELPDGALPFDRDITIAAAGINLLLDPGAGYKFYLASAFVSTDTAMRVAIIDEADLQNQRPVDGYFPANGGATPNLVGKLYGSKNTGNRIQVVTGALGNVKVRVSGYTLPG